MENVQNLPKYQQAEFERWAQEKLAMNYAKTYNDLIAVSFEHCVKTGWGGVSCAVVVYILV